jgi:hypothetical protein
MGRAFGKEERHHRYSDEPAENSGPRKSYPRRERDGRDEEPRHHESKRGRPSYGRAGQKPKEPTKQWGGRRDSETNGPKRGGFSKHAPTKARPGSKPDSGAKRAARSPKRKNW